MGKIELEPAGPLTDCSEGCLWTNEMGRRLAGRGSGEPIELPVCPEICDKTDCTIRRYEKP